MLFNVFRKVILVQIALFLLINISFSQERMIPSADQNKVLSEIFKDYSIVEWNIDQKKLNHLKEERFSTIHWPVATGDIATFESRMVDMHSENAPLRFTDESTVDRSTHQSPILIKGHTTQYEHRLSLTLNEGFAYGTIQVGGDTYFIEPLSYYTLEQSENLFVSYRAEDAILQHLPDFCAVTQARDKKEELIPHDHATNRVVGDCYEVEIALAADFSMFQSYGNSTAAVENHLLGVLNNVQTDYDDAFADELLFVVSETFLVNCSGCDPWTSSNEAGTLLNSFRNWGPSGFFATHDVGGLWTNRNFDGSTIGIAYVGVICGGSRYHCVQDFSSNANLLRVVWSHELGHNFDSDHDASGSGFIMAPSVNNTTSWSPASINFIQNHYLSRTCLDNCASSSLPVSNFSFNAPDPCAPSVVSFTSTSTGASNYFWDFPGGNPSTSTQSNPVVTYNDPGTFDVTLEVSNSVGSDSYSEFGIIEVGDAPSAGFTYTSNGAVFNFISTSTGTNLSYIWSFGNGGTSNQQNPIVNYGSDGIYTVILEVSNACDISVITDVIEVVTVPVASFNATAYTACVDEPITFLNTSTLNTANFEWMFEGGSPATSTATNPIVEYTSGGLFDVQLSASNSAGTDVLIESDLIQILDNPLANFNYTVNGLTVSFNNLSANASSYIWDLGDGTITPSLAPTHTYNSAGVYVVQLEASNTECAAQVFTLNLELNLLPIPAFEAVSTVACVSSDVAFMDLSENDPTAWLWTFDGGTPSSSTDQNPIVNYSQSGFYNVSLQVTNIEGSATTTISEYIEINAPPVADFSTSGVATTVNFDNNSNGASTFSWDFGDGNTSTQPDPAHIYAAEGIYDVTLEVSNDCGDDIYTQTIDLYTTPTVDFNFDVSTICIGETVQFTENASSNVNSYLWTFEGGSPATSTELMPNVAYNTPGMYNVSLEVSNPTFSNILTQQQVITVMESPTAIASFAAVGLTIDFASPVSNADSYFWDFGDGNVSNEQNPVHTYASEGDYTATLQVTNMCGSDVTTLSLALYSAPTAAFSSSSTSGCSPFTVDFINESSDNASSFIWMFQGGTPAMSTEENPSVIYNSPGKYEVTLVASNPGFDNTVVLSNYINVGDIPSGDFSASTDDYMASFQPNITNANSYQWSFGDGSTSVEPSPSHIYDVEGDYEVILVVTNACGSFTISNTVSISLLAIANFTAMNTTGCGPLEVSYENRSSDNAKSYLWTFEGGEPSTSTDANPVVVYTTPGTYATSLIIESLNDMDEIVYTDFITVLPDPRSMFNTTMDENQVILTNTSQNATSYLWDFGDGNTSTSFDTTHEYTASGTYTITLTAYNECGESISSATVDIVISSLDEAIMLNDLLIYPNPNHGRFFIEFESKLNDVIVVQVLDLLGRTVYHESMNVYQDQDIKKEISLNMLAQSTYLLVLKSSESNTIRKINILE